MSDAVFHRLVQELVSAGVPWQQAIQRIAQSETEQAS